MTNRGIKKIYESFIDEEIGEYYINLNKNGNVNIEDSYKIVTPWVQFGYSFYLNHINKKTRNVIKGTTFGVQFELMAHNISFYYGKIFRKKDIVKKSRSADIGSTIFDDYDSDADETRKIFSGLMIGVYILTSPLLATIFDLVSWRKK